MRKLSLPPFIWIALIPFLLSPSRCSFFGDWSFDERVLHVHALIRQRLSRTNSDDLELPFKQRPSLAPDPPLEFLDHFEALIRRRAEQHVASTARRNGRRFRRGKEPLGEPWSVEEAYEKFAEAEGRDSITGASVLDSQLFWAIGFDRCASPSAYTL
jgi:hypothetical protein